MKRTVITGSCLGFMALCVLGSMAALLLFSVVFNQSQATTQNVQATLSLRTTANVATRVTAPTSTKNSPMPTSGSTVSSSEMMVTIDSGTSTVVSVPNDAEDQASKSSTPVPSPMVNATGVPGLPPLGTSTYPLTVTAEVMLAQTHVAKYQDGVSATRTAVEAESQNVFATLTARAPTKAAK